MLPPASVAVQVTDETPTGKRVGQDEVVPGTPARVIERTTVTAVPQLSVQVTVGSLTAAPAVVPVSAGTSVFELGTPVRARLFRAVTFVKFVPMNGIAWAVDEVARLVKPVVASEKMLVALQSGTSARKRRRATLAGMLPVPTPVPSPAMARAWAPDPQHV